MGKKIKMSKLAVLVLVFVSLIASCLVSVQPTKASEDSWTTKASMNVARDRLGVATVNGKIYAIGGDTSQSYGYSFDIIGSGYSPISINEEYDPTFNFWENKSSMPTPRFSFGIAVYQNKIYCIGGRSTGGRNANGDLYDTLPTGANEVYDPATDKWETKTPMPMARGYIQANIVNGKIYVIDGSVNEVYDPKTDKWETKTPPPYPVLYFVSTASAVANGKIYFIARGYSQNTSTYYPYVQIYEPSTDSWSAGAEAPSYMKYATAAATTSLMAPKRIYFFDQTGTFVYNTANNTWSTGATMLAARSYVGVSTINDTFYVVGGENLTLGILIGGIFPVNTTEQYTPVSYGTPDPSQQSPSPTLSLSPTPSVASPSTPTASHAQPLTPSPYPNQTSTQTPSSLPTSPLSPSPSIPEFPTGIILGLFLAATMLTVVFFRNKIAKKPH
jgi:hypothetical protein